MDHFPKKAKQLVDPYHYVYGRNTKIGHMDHYVCVNSQKGTCRAKAYVKGETLVCTFPHTHAPDLLVVKQKEVRTKVKALVEANPRTATVSLVTEWTSQVLKPELMTSSPMMSTMSRAVNKWKAKELMRPKVPIDDEDSVLDMENIPDRYKTTVDGQPFLRYNSYP